MTDGAKENARVTHAVVDMVKNGPPEGAGTIRWFIGSWLWWRMQATAALVAIPLVAGMIAIPHTSSFGAVIVTYLAAMVVSNKITKVSPKYELTKNY